MIDVTGIDLVKFAQKVYELSSPQGLGFLHYTPTPLSEEEAKQNIQNGSLDMDYVNGRACKMHVRNKNGRLEINDSWYDHTDQQLQSLLSAFNIEAKPTQKHSATCECVDCVDPRKPK